MQSLLPASGSMKAEECPPCVWLVLPARGPKLRDSGLSGCISGVGMERPAARGHSECTQQLRAWHVPFRTSSTAWHPGALPRLCPSSALGPMVTAAVEGPRLVARLTPIRPAVHPACSILISHRFMSAVAPESPVTLPSASNTPGHESTGAGSLLSCSR